MVNESRLLNFRLIYIYIFQRGWAVNPMAELLAGQALQVVLHISPKWLNPPGTKLQGPY